MTVTPNIIWVTLDSIRADHTSMGGYDRNTTPELERIAESNEGRWYGECISHGRWSLPSISSILTGTYPFHHQTGLGNNILPDTVTTIPERLSEVGYTTACISRNPHLSHETNLDRGFDRFTYINPETILNDVGVKTLLKYLVNIRRHSAGFCTTLNAHSTPFLVNDLAKRWIANVDDDPLFMYLHYNEPHTPYYPPLPYLEQFTDHITLSSKEAVELVLDVYANMQEYIAHGCEFTEDEWAAIKAMYDAEIYYTDKCIGRLFDYAQEKLSGETIFFVTADHGDLFGEYGLLGHKLVLHDGLTHVPMITHGLQLDRELVQHADFMKTIVNSVGANSEGIQGYDLRTEERQFTVSQTGEPNFDEFAEFNPGFDTERFHQSPYSAVRTSQYKLCTSDDRSEFFELPDETNDQSDTYPDEKHSLAAQFEEWSATHIDPQVGEQVEYSDSMKRRLEDLGYL